MNYDKLEDSPNDTPPESRSRNPTISVIYPSREPDSISVRSRRQSPIKDANQPSITLIDEQAATEEYEETKPQILEKRESFQMKALLYKTLSFQKRQLFINFCCVILCPLLVVTLCTLVSLIINNIMSSMFPPSTVLECSNTRASTDNTLFPIRIIETLPYSGIYQGLRNVRSVSDLSKINSYLRYKGINIPLSDTLNAKVYHANYKLFGSQSPITSQVRRSIQFGNFKRCTYWFGNNYTFSSPYSDDPKPNLTILAWDT
jgi:hypothetical protein